MMRESPFDLHGGWAVIRFVSCGVFLWVSMYKKGVKLGWVSSVPGTECTCMKTAYSALMQEHARWKRGVACGVGSKTSASVCVCLWKVLPSSVVVFSCQLVVDCLCPAMVITADDALPCQAVTPLLPLNYHLSVTARETEGRVQGETRGQRGDLAECLRGV